MATIKKTFPIMGMSCASCAGHVEKALKSKNGVKNAVVNLAANTATIEYDTTVITPQDMQKAVQDAGYDMLVNAEDDDSDRVDQLHTKEYLKLRNKTIGAISLALPTAIIGMFFMDMPYGNYIMWLLTTIILFVFGRSFYVNAWKQAKHKTANMDTLVALSTGVAYLFSVFNVLFPSFWIERGVEPHVYFEASAVIIAFILLGRLLEDKAKGNTSTALKKLMGLQPKLVTIVSGNEGFQIQNQIPIEKVNIGNIILVKPGEKIAVDGVVTQGSSYVDESMLSGEPIPALKEKGEKVFAGTINQKSSFQFQAEKIGADTILSQIIKRVQEAQGSKAPVQRLVDKIAGIFVPVVVVIAILSFAIWILFGGDNAFTHAILALVTVLIIACPCALGLATPTAIMVGIGKGAENGILIKDAESLESARKINAIVLDKTGTITQGKPEISDIVWLNNDNNTEFILVSIEKQSEHPLAEAIVRGFPNVRESTISDFESVTGRGVKAVYDGQQYYVGSLKWMNDNDLQISTALMDSINMYNEQAKSVICFADNKQVLAVIAITDKIKDSSKDVINQLQNSGIDVYMLTGDNDATARAIANQTGLKHYKSDVLPNEKEEFVKQLQLKNKTVAMVGDGINDSAALARADVSIAMGTGSDIAMDVASITIVSGDLTKITKAIKLSQDTVKTIRQNLFWAFIYNLIGIPIAAGILYPINGFLLNPMIAGLAMALSSVSVVSNSLRLKTKKL